MKQLLWIFITFLSCNIVFAETDPDLQMDVEQAVIDTDSAQADAQEAKKTQAEENKRTQQLRRDSERALAKSKATIDQAKKYQAGAEEQIAKAKAQSLEYSKQLKKAEEKTALAQKQIQDAKDKLLKVRALRDEGLEKKKAVEANMLTILAEAKDHQMQVKEAVAAANAASKEAALALAKEKRSYAILEATRLQAKKAMAKANAQAAKAKAAAQKAEAARLRNETATVKLRPANRPAQATTRKQP